MKFNIKYPHVDVSGYPRFVVVNYSYFLLLARLVHDYSLFFAEPL